MARASCGISPPLSVLNSLKTSESLSATDKCNESLVAVAMIDDGDDSCPFPKSQSWRLRPKRSVGCRSPLRSLRSEISEFGACDYDTRPGKLRARSRARARRVSTSARARRRVTWSRALFPPMLPFTTTASLLYHASTASAWPLVSAAHRPSRRALRSAISAGHTPLSLPWPLALPPTARPWASAG